MGGDEKDISQSHQSRKYILITEEIFIKVIFVTVGTHEQPFDRLVKKIDDLKTQGIIDEEVVIQTGYSNYEPIHCTWEKLYPYKDMLRFVNDARIIITHGGPSSFIMPLQIGKVPIVVPRQVKYGEHINNHQVTFCKAVEERNGNIIVVSDMDGLGEVITTYESRVRTMKKELKSNNEIFCGELAKIVEELWN